MTAGQRVFFIVLVILGIYLLAWHMPPFPGNHEAIGLGKLHIVHDVIAVILIIGAVLIWRRARMAKPAEQPAA